MSLEELRDRIAANAGRAHLPVDGALVAMTERGTAPTPLLTGPVMALVAQGAKCAVLGERPYAYVAGQCPAVSIDLPVTGNYTRASAEEPFLGIGMTLEPAAIAELLLETEDRPPRGVPRSGI